MWKELHMAFIIMIGNWPKDDNFLGVYVERVFVSRVTVSGIA